MLFVPDILKQARFKNNTPQKKILTHSKLENCYYFSDLNSFEKSFLGLFERGFSNLSYKQIQQCLKLNSKRSARYLIEVLEERGFLAKKANFLGQTKIHAKNYYSLTKKGREYKKSLLEKACKNEPIPKNNQPHLKFEETELGFSVKTLKKEEIEVLKNEPKCKEKNSAHRTRSLKRDQLSQEELSVFSQKKNEIIKIFEEEGLKKELSRINRFCFRKLINLSLDKTKKLVSFIAKKLRKGFKLKNFWGFFMRICSDMKPFWKEKSDIMKVALRDEFSEERKMLKQGIDTSVVLHGLEALEEETNADIKPEFVDRMFKSGQGNMGRISTAFRIFSALKNNKNKTKVDLGPGFLLWLIKENFQSQQAFFDSCKERKKTNSLKKK